MVKVKHSGESPAYESAPERASDAPKLVVVPSGNEIGALGALDDLSALYTLFPKGSHERAQAESLLETARTRVQFMGRRATDLEMRAVTAETEAEQARAQAAAYKQASYRDRQTGLFDKAFLQERLSSTLAAYAKASAAVYDGKAPRKISTPGVIIADLDDFGALNKDPRYGDRVGDMVIAAVSQTLRDTLRDKDVISQTGTNMVHTDDKNLVSRAGGGEEFCVLLDSYEEKGRFSSVEELARHDMEAMAAYAMVAERVRAAIETNVPQFLAERGVELDRPLTASVGAAIYTPSIELLQQIALGNHEAIQAETHPETGYVELSPEAARLYDQVTAAMRQAKTDGKNLVRTGHDIIDPTPLLNIFELQRSKSA